MLGFIARVTQQDLNRILKAKNAKEKYLEVPPTVEHLKWLANDFVRTKEHRQRKEVRKLIPFCPPFQPIRFETPAASAHAASLQHPSKDQGRVKTRKRARKVDARDCY